MEKAFTRCWALQGLYRETLNPVVHQSGGDDDAENKEEEDGEGDDGDAAGGDYKDEAMFNTLCTICDVIFHKPKEKGSSLISN